MQMLTERVNEGQAKKAVGISAGSADWASCFFRCGLRADRTSGPTRHPGSRGIPFFPKGTNITLLNCTVRHHPTQSTPPHDLATGGTHTRTTFTGPQHHSHTACLAQSLVRRGELLVEFRCAYLQNMSFRAAVATFFRAGGAPPAPCLCALRSRARRRSLGSPRH